MRRKNRAERERTEHYWKLHFLHSRTFSPITFFESCAWNWNHKIYTCILIFFTHLTVRISTNFMLCFLSLPFCMHRSPFITHLLLSLNQPLSHPLHLFSISSHIITLGCKAVLRMGSISNNKNDGPAIAITDNGNYIVDLFFTAPIADVALAAKEIKATVGKSV